MTDKQIIDGVDVAGCRYFTSEWDFNNCGYVCKGTECKYKRLWYKKQLDKLKVENKKLTKNYFTVIQQRNIAEQQLDQLKGVIKKYEKCNKYLVEESGKTYTRLDYKLLKTLTEIQEIAKQCFGKDFCTDCKYSEQCYVEDGKASTYDVCKLILQKVSEAVYD